MFHFNVCQRQDKRLARVSLRVVETINQYVPNAHVFENGFLFFGGLDKSPTQAALGSGRAWKYRGGSR